jgi:RNA polymerase sigma factor (sigma-70 family)
MGRQPVVQRGSAQVSEGSPQRRVDAGRVFRQERAAVLRHLVYLTGDRQVAEDLTQETFGRFCETAEEPANVRAWLLKVASNLAYNHFRGESRRLQREAQVAPSSSPDVDEVLDVRCALETLDPRDRAVLMLRHSGFAYAEIAEATGLAPSSVGTILARAQRRFREAYEGTGGATGSGALEKE